MLRELVLGRACKHNGSHNTSYSNGALGPFANSKPGARTRLPRAVCSVLRARRNRGSVSAIVISTSSLLASGHDAPTVLDLVD
jgi:hypothetical protein